MIQKKQLFRAWFGLLKNNFSIGFRLMFGKNIIHLSVALLFVHFGFEIDDNVYLVPEPGEMPRPNANFRAVQIDSVVHGGEYKYDAQKGTMTLITMD